MKFQLQCDDMDALALIDRGYLKEFDDDLLYAMDIFLDPSGRSELIYDFPGEDWETVWERETEPVRKLCKGGKIFLKQIPEDRLGTECELVHTDHGEEGADSLHMPTGKLLVVSAGELIQCLAYPELEMEILFETELKPGWYALVWQNNGKIKYREMGEDKEMLSER